MSHTYATLEVMPTAYDHIAALLRVAQYHHAFADDGAEYPTVDMHGIGLQRGEGSVGQPTRRVVCAAIRAADGSLLLGVRHYSEDMHEQIRQRMDGAKFKHRHDEDQGFVDQHGVFMSRHEAFVVAMAAMQINRLSACGEDPDGPKLYSEGLY